MCFKIRLGEEKVNNNYTKAYTDDVVAYEEQDRLTSIVRDLKRRLKDLHTRERMLNTGRGRKKY